MTFFAFGQNKTEKALFDFLNANKIDTFISIKSSCTYCTISYEETSKPVDSVTIKLLYRQKGKQYLMAFSDTAQKKMIGKVESSVFGYILNNRKILNNKAVYYKEAKLAKFQSPCLVTFPYEAIDIKMGQFKYKHTLVERERDDCGTILIHYDWFKVEKEILSQVDAIKIK